MITGNNYDHFRRLKHEFDSELKILLMLETELSILSIVYNEISDNSLFL